MFNLQHLLGRNSISTGLPACRLCFSSVMPIICVAVEKVYNPVTWAMPGFMPEFSGVQLLSCFIFKGYLSLLFNTAGISLSPKEIINSISPTKRELNTANRLLISPCTQRQCRSIIYSQSDVRSTFNQSQSIHQLACN